MIKLNTVKRYVKENLKSKIRNQAVEALISEFDKLIKTSLGEAKKNSQEARRATILHEDIISPLEKFSGNRTPSTGEILTYLKNLNAIELGSLIKDISAYINTKENEKE